MNTEQCFYDEIIHFVLQTISSEEYLTDVGIYYKKYKAENFDRCVFHKIHFQSKGLKEGIYPNTNYEDGISVHYFAIRKNKKGEFILANGYKDNFNLNYSIGLNAQPNHSHGLCQTFALMYLTGNESKIKKGKYFENVKIGLNFLYNFIQENYEERERIWTLNQLYNSIEKMCQMTKKSRISRYRNITKNFKYGFEEYISSKHISLSILIRYLLDENNIPYLNKWFYNI